MPPPQKATKKAAEAGSSSGGRKEPTDSGKAIEDEKRYFRQLLFVAYHRFLHGSRHLNRDEVIGMAPIISEKASFKASVRSVSSLLDIFDDPKDSVTIELEKSISKNEEQLVGEVQGIFEIFLTNDEEARDRCGNLDGLTKRLPKFAMHNAPKWASKVMRLDQFALCYAMAHFCRDHSGKSLGSTVYKDVLQEKSSITLGAVHFTGTIFQDQDFVKHFATRAHELLTEYELEMGNPEPLLVIPGEPRRADLCSTCWKGGYADTHNREPGPDLDVTTKSVAALSLTATAPASRQPTKTSTEKDEFDDMINWEGNEGQDTRASSPPAEGSDSEPTGKGKGKGKGKEKEKEEEGGKGKGKQRERESSSNSPGEGGSGRPEEKKQRRGGEKLN